MITGSSPQLIAHYQREITQRFKVTLLGPIRWLLGIEIIRDREAHTLSLSQHSYIASILTIFNMAEAKE
jgi:hypothetical protein